MIPTVTVSVDKNPHCYRNQGTATEDKVFLLGVNEADRYFGSDGERMCKATAYADRKGDYNGYECMWLLRSSGSREYNAAAIYPDGSIDYFGTTICYGEIGVRPALWINLLP